MNRIAIALQKFFGFQLPVGVYPLFGNLRAILKGQTVRFSIGGSRLRSEEKGSTHFSGHIRRGVHVIGSAGGLLSRGKVLRDGYLLDLIQIHVRSLVDVGANSGDMLLALPDLQSYLGVEPVEEEYRALELNCKMRKLGQPVLCAASDHEGLFDFYVSLDGGDSSFVRPAGGFSEVRRVRAEQLDSILDKEKFLENEAIDLLKVEAEGYELEVLQGAKDTISRSKWVVVDGGPERGINSESTVERCIAYLTKLELELVGINLNGRPGVALFQNPKSI